MWKQEETRKRTNRATQNVNKSGDYDNNNSNTSSSSRNNGYKKIRIKTGKAQSTAQIRGTRCRSSRKLYGKFVGRQNGPVEKDRLIYVPPCCPYAQIFIRSDIYFVILFTKRFTGCRTKLLNGSGQSGFPGRASSVCRALKPQTFSSHLLHHLRPMLQHHAGVGCIHPLGTFYSAQVKCNTPALNLLRHSIRLFLLSFQIYGLSLEPILSFRMNI